MKKEFDLGRDKINKLLISFAIPCVISMLINSVYNIVDQIFIGKGVGTLGNAATNVIFPLVILANAIAGLIGNGAAANLSLKLGEKKVKRYNPNTLCYEYFLLLSTFKFDAQCRKCRVDDYGRLILKLHDELLDFVLGIMRACGNVNAKYIETEEDYDIWELS